MRFWTIWAAAAALAAPTAAVAQDGFAVGMGEEIVLTFDAAPKASLPTRIAPNAFEIREGLGFSRGDHDEAIGPAWKPMTGETPTVAPNLIRVRLTPVAGKKPGSLLVIANGYDRAFIWRAVMRVRGHSSPTDVCLVMPGKTGIEHWPYAIEAIGLIDARLEPWKPEDGVRCE